MSILLSYEDLNIVVFLLTYIDNKYFNSLAKLLYMDRYQAFNVSKRYVPIVCLDCRYTYLERNLDGIKDKDMKPYTIPISKEGGKNLSFFRKLPKMGHFKPQLRILCL